MKHKFKYPRQKKANRRLRLCRWCGMGKNDQLYYLTKRRKIIN